MVGLVATFLSLDAIAASGPVIQQIGGGRQFITILTPNGEKVVPAGTQLNPGESIKTDGRTSIKLSYPDGSNVYLGRDGNMEYQGDSDGAPKQQINVGRIRVKVKKDPNPKNKDQKTRFILRTKSAVIGVRGTEFVASAAVDGALEVRTLEGIVQVAKNENALASGIGVVVQQDEMVKADVLGISAVEKFDRREFLKEVEKEQAEIESGTAEASTGPEQKRRRFFELIRFRLWGFHIQETRSHGYFRSGELSWNPRIRPLSWLSAGVSFSIFPLKFADTNEKVIGHSGALIGELDLFENIGFEVGFGRQGWGDQEGEGYETRGNVRFRLGDGIIDALVLGVNYFRRPVTPIDPTLKFSVGLELNI